MIKSLVAFTYYYPLFMAYLWMSGALWFYFRHEVGKHATPKLTAWPKVSIVVPCYNEEDNVLETIGHLFKMDYPDYEIIAVNDGSKDRTGELLDQLAQQNSKLRVIHQAKNQGKAIGLNTAAYLASSEIIVGIDGDALLAHDAIPWLMRHFQENPRVGAVTGNPRIRTRSTLLGRLQVGEFSSLVGLIKRAQRTFYGRLFTASGVITAFRRSALHDVGYWSPDMLTEDMDITWKLQLKGWDIRFEPHALVWILMPETLKGLWKQRLRWAVGGIQVIGRHGGMLKHLRTYPMWPLFFEHVLSVVWAYAMAVVLSLSLLHLATPSSFGLPEMSLLPGLAGVIIGTTCLLQMFLSMLMDRHYDRGILRYYVWTIWYPFAFWMVNMLTILVALPQTLLRKRGARARWVSPDRGLTVNPDPNQQETRDETTHS